MGTQKVFLFLSCCIACLGAAQPAFSLSGGESNKASLLRKTEENVQKSSQALVKSVENGKEAKPVVEKKKVDKIKLRFFSYDNPFLDAAARWETAYYSLIEKWNVDDESSYHYEWINECADILEQKSLEMANALKTHPGLREGKVGLSEDNAFNVARLARFSTEFSTAADCQEKRKLIEKWDSINLVVKKLRKCSWWPKPEKIVIAEDPRKPAEIPTEEEVGAADTSGGR